MFSMAANWLGLRVAFSWSSFKSGSIGPLFIIPALQHNAELNPLRLARQRLPGPSCAVQQQSAYRLVRLASGAYSVRSVAHGETFHPVIGPVAEAEALYVGQLELRRQLATAAGEFVIWDIGLGAAANPLTVIRASRDSAVRLRI